MNVFTEKAINITNHLFSFFFNIKREVNVEVHKENRIIVKNTKFKSYLTPKLSSRIVKRSFHKKTLSLLESRNQHV